MPPLKPLRIGLKCVQQAIPVAILQDVWRIADEAGFDHCWLFDHLAAAGPDITAPVFDAWTLIGAMAQGTRRVRPGVLVTCNTYRNPAVLAKSAVTADHISGGRLEMGMGAGYVEREHTMLGIEFGTMAERIARLDEACQLMKLLWTRPQASFDGHFYQLVNAISEPKPVQRPHPPLWIGGSGERLMLRVVAKHADVWNVPAVRAISPGTIGIDEVTRLSRVLDGHCEAAGRDPASVRRSVQFKFDGDLDSAVKTAETYLRAGVSELVLMIGGADPRALAEAAASGLLPRLRLLGESDPDTISIRRSQQRDSNGTATATV